MSIPYTYILPFAVATACSFAPFAGLRAADEAAEQPAAEDPAIKEELAFIDALVEANMPDFAEPVIAAAKKKWPQLSPKLKVRELQGALRLGKFDEVQKVVDGMKQKNGEYWALRLSMADAYYARGMMPECRKIYGEFFKTVQKPGADLIDFYVESGFKWAQMCVTEKKLDEAVAMYTQLLARIPNAGDTEERWCAVAMETVSLYIRLIEETVVDPADAKKAKELTAKRKGYFAAATKLVNQLLWKNELIIVFGKAIAMKAHLELLEGNLEKAQQLVNDYMPDLKKIHDSLIEQDPQGKLGYVRMSPMPECRYLLAKLLWEAAKAEAKAEKPDEEKIKSALLGAKVSGKRNGLGAFNHAVNVYVKYPESTAAASAGQIYEEVSAFVLERYKKDLKKAVKISPAQMETVRKMQFNNAYSMFREGNYAETIKTYTALIAQFPEAEEIPGAVGMVADSNLELWQKEKDPAKKDEFRKAANAAEEDLAARFAGKGDVRERTAGDEIQRLAVKEREIGAAERSDQLFALYFEKFASHYNAAQRALGLAGQAYKSEDWKTAARYYGLVATAYTNSPHYVSALQFLATCCEKQDDRDGRIKWMRAFANATPKVDARSGTLLQLALMEQKDAYNAFAQAAETNDVEASQAICKAANRSVAGAIRDFRAVAKAVEGELESNKGLKAEEKEKFLLRREQALFLEGDIWSRLTYPEERKSAYRTRAVDAFERYLAAFPKGKYGAVALVKIGTIHTAEKKMDESQKAFARLQKDFPESDEAKNSVPRLAKTLIEMGLREEGVAQYKQMLETQGGKYSSGQFLAAGDALLEAKGWDVAGDAYAKSIELAAAVTNEAARSAIVARCLIGQAKVSLGQKQYAQARQKLDDFIEKNAKSALVKDAYEMLVEVASIEGSTEKDDEVRLRLFNSAVGAVKKLRGFIKDQKSEEGRLALDGLALRSGDVLVRKMEAEDAMNLKEKADETCSKAVVSFQAFLMAHEPTEENPAEKMSPAQLANLERCYSSCLPLMVRVISKMPKETDDEKAAKAEQRAQFDKYAATYQKLFPNGKNKVAVQNAVNQAKAE